MRYNITEEGIALVELAGEIDIVNADTFKADCLELIDRECKDIIFDCRNLDFIDSTALGSIVAVKKYAESKGIAIRLKNLKPRLSKLFAITSLDTIIAID